MRLKNLLIAVLLVTLICGCAQISDMFRIIKALSKEYNHRNINIEIHNNKEMTVNFINSPFNNLEEPQREEKARDIALSCVSLFKPDSTTEKIIVVFTIYEKKFLIVDYTNTLSVYSFDVSELKKELEEKTI
ncbi:MAG: hypothetical protein PHW62_02350 [Candidatus Ratteibacteria bacterium]|nr:hypothetical protein [Candidatus Ratteibacteria bacterium]